MIRQFLYSTVGTHRPSNIISANMCLICGLEAHHRFTAEEADWGFTRFVELRELSTPNDKRPRPLVEGDSARLTAYVKIMKDPTGVLWHSFVK
jgi:hypothetical protein